MLAITPFLGAAVLFGGLWSNSQWRHLRQVKQHIAAIEDEWMQFQRENAGLELVVFFPYTGGDGMFGITREVPSARHIDLVMSFVEATSPPRPIHCSIFVIDQDTYIEAVMDETGRDVSGRFDP